MLRISMMRRRSDGWGFERFEDELEDILGTSYDGSCREE